MSKKRRRCIIVEETDNEGRHAAEELEEQISLKVRTKGTAVIRQYEGKADEEEEKYFKFLYICVINKSKFLKHVLFLLFTLNLIAYLFSFT